MAGHGKPAKPDPLTIPAFARLAAKYRNGPPPGYELAVDEKKQINTARPANRYAKGDDNHRRPWRRVPGGWQVGKRDPAWNHLPALRDELHRLLSISGLTFGALCERTGHTRDVVAAALRMIKPRVRIEKNDFTYVTLRNGPPHPTYGLPSLRRGRPRSLDRHREFARPENRRAG